MIVSSFRFSLDLVVQLIDTTNGRPVDARQIIFLEKGELLPLVWKDIGLYILQNHGRTNMTLEVKAKGYEEIFINVDYEKLDEREPRIEIPLIPKFSNVGMLNFETYTGKKEGLVSVAAVNSNEVFATANFFNERKQIIKLLNSRPLNEESFGVVTLEKDSFEEIYIKKRIDNLTIKLKDPLAKPLRPEQIITRIIRGRVEEDGGYRLVVRRNSSKDNFIVRFEIKSGDTTTYEYTTLDTKGEQ